MKNLLHFLGPVTIALLAACNPLPLNRIGNTPTLENAPIVLPKITPTTQITASATFEEIRTDLPRPTSPPRIQNGQAILPAHLMMVDEQIGWGIDTLGRIIRTRDGGNSWIEVTPLLGTYSEKSFFALDANHAWAVSSQPGAPENANGVDNPIGCGCLLWETSNGGVTWRKIIITADQSIQISQFESQGVFFENTKTGWIIGSDASKISPLRMSLFNTTDGGLSWKQTHFELQSKDRFNGIVFLDPQRGYTDAAPFGVSEKTETPTVGDYIDGSVLPHVWKTIDGGIVWNEIDLPSLNPIPEEWMSLAASAEQVDCTADSPLFLPPQGIKIAVECRFLNADLPENTFTYVSADGGQSWHSWLMDGPEYFLSSEKSWRLIPPKAGQLTELQNSTDGGATWKKVISVAWPKAQLQFINGQMGWAIVSDGDSTSLVRTRDGGKSWGELKPKALIAISTENFYQISKQNIWPSGLTDVLAISPDWSSLVTFPNYSVLELWQFNKKDRGAYLPFLQDDCGLRGENTVMYSPDGTMVAAALCNGTTKVWRVSDGKLILNAKGEILNGSAISPNGALLATADRTQTVMIWRISDGTLLGVLPTEDVWNVAFSPDSESLAVGSKDGLDIWRIANTPMMKKTLSLDSFSMSNVSYSPDGEILASSAMRWGLQLWDVKDGTRLTTLDASCCDSYPLNRIVFSPDGTILALADSENGNIVNLWQIPEGELLHSFSGVDLPVGFSPDGALLAIGSPSGVQIWGISEK